MDKERRIIKTIRTALGLPHRCEDAEDAENAGRGILITTDMLLDGDDFPHRMKPRAKGWTAAASQLSDLAAAGAAPKTLVFSWAIPKKTTLAEIREIASGMRDCVKRFGKGAKIAGGDMNESERLVLNGAGIGCAKKRIRRSGAKPGDVLCITGALGASAAGYLILQKNLRARHRDYLVKKFSFPIPRVKEALSISRFVTAATDLSDGLVIGVYNLCEESRVGCVVNEEKIPFEKGVFELAKSINKTAFSLACVGSDYELLLAIPEKNFAKARKKCKLTRIGFFTKGKKVFLKKSGRNGKKIFLKRKGFQHFS